MFIKRFVDFQFVSENVGRLKKLEYLNLALNNVEKIENLESKYEKNIHILTFIVVLKIELLQQLEKK